MDTLELTHIFASVLYTECIAGIIINLIIVAVIFVKWKTTKSLHMGDKILSSLATSRCLYLFSIFLNYLLPRYDLWEGIDEYLQFMYIMLIVSLFLYSTDLWFAAILCVFYCVKITNYNWKFFIFLKTKISTLVPWFLLSSVLISVFSSLPLVWCVYDIQEHNLTGISMENGNMTLVILVMIKNPQEIFLLSLTGSCPPSLVFLGANFLLLYSLWMHIRRMRSSGSGFRSPNLESHFSAVKSMSLFSVLQIIYVICMNVHFSGTADEIPTHFWISIIVICSLPSLHSLYIIYSNSELKKNFCGLTC